MDTTAAPQADNQQVRHRAFRFALDPTVDQEAAFRRAVGASRKAYNDYVAEARKRRARWAAHRESLVSRGYAGDELDQRMRADAESAETTNSPMKILSVTAFDKDWLTPARDDHKERAERIKAGADPQTVLADDRYDTPWLHQTHRRVLVSGLRMADQALRNWMSSITGERAGRSMGFPKFKQRGSHDSFTMPTPEKMGVRGTTFGRGRNSQRIDDYRHVYASFLGSIRIHDSTRRMVRSIERGGTIRSFTLSRGASRWYISFLVQEPFTPPAPTRTQRSNGTVGADLGVKTAGALSTGEFIDNPKRGNQEKRRITKLQRKIARTQKGSNRRVKLVRMLAATHHRIAQRRETDAHKLTKHLATSHARVGIEDLNVAGMTASAKGTIENPGTNVKAKSGLNRSCQVPGFIDGERVVSFQAAALMFSTAA